MSSVGENKLEFKVDTSERDIQQSCRTRCKKTFGDSLQTYSMTFGKPSTIEAAKSDQADAEAQPANESVEARPQEPRRTKRSRRNPRPTNRNPRKRRPRPRLRRKSPLAKKGRISHGPRTPPSLKDRPTRIAPAAGFAWSRPASDRNWPGCWQRPRSRRPTPRRKTPKSSAGEPKRHAARDR